MKYAVIIEAGHRTMVRTSRICPGVWPWARRWMRSGS